MSITFNTNVSALTAQRYVGVASAKTSSSLAKLSSGSRVPTAKDDAAGLAVGSKLKAEVSALTQASNNAAQAGTMLQIADGALSTTSDILNRMKSLAVQASSGQLADAERSLLNQEFTNLRSEIDRIANVTNFNGTSLLNGGDAVATFTDVRTGGLSAKGITISADTSKTAADAVYRVDYDVTGAVGNLTVTDLTSGQKQTVDIGSMIRGQTGQAAGALTTNLSAGQSVDVKFDALGINLKLDNRFDVDTDYGQSFAGSATSTVQSSVSTNTTLTMLAGGDMTGAQLAAATTFDAVTGNLTLNVKDDVNDKLDILATAGLEFSADGITFAATLDAVAVNGTGEDSFFVRATGADQAFAKVTIAAAADVVGASGGATRTLVIGGVGDGITRGVETTTTTKQFSFKVGTGTTGNDNIGFTLSAATTAALGVNSATIDSAANANTAITGVTAAISTVASRRADIGANQSRLDFAAASVSVAIENTTAAQSALLDVDVSSEITKFSSQQVLLQAGISLLAQANQQPSQLLKLLG